VYFLALSIDKGKTSTGLQSPSTLRSSFVQHDVLGVKVCVDSFGVGALGEHGAAQADAPRDAHRSGHHVELCSDLRNDSLLQQADLAGAEDAVHGGVYPEFLPERDELGLAGSASAPRTGARQALLLRIGTCP